MNDSFINQKENFFNLWAPHYDCLLTTVFYQAIHQRLLDYVNLENHASILDLGCGTGRLLHRLASEFPNVRGIGLDLSPLMLRVARQRNQFKQRLIFVRGNAEALSFAEEQFAAVFCTISFLHYPNPSEVLQQISRVLAVGGKFYLVDNDRGVINQLNSVPQIGKMRAYNRHQREQLGIEAGLSCLGHYSLLPGILLTIFTKLSPSEQN